MLLLLDLLDDDDESLLALGGGVEVFAPVITGDYPFFSAGFFSAEFFSDGFWGQSVQPMASLGSYGPMPRKKKRLDDDLNEVLPADVISRLSDEMVAASVTANAVKQAKRRRSEAILLLMM